MEKVFACYFELIGSSAVLCLLQGFKLSLNGKDVSAVSENDRHFLQLQWTLELLQIRLNTLDLKVET